MRLDYNIYFEVAAAFFIMSLILYVQLQYSMNTKRNRMFQKLTILTLAADILDVVTAVTNSNADMVPYWVNMVLNTVYFVSIVLLGTQFYSYAKQFNEDEKEGIKSSIRSNILSLSAFCLFIIILGVNLFTGVVFDFVDGEYVHGVLYFTVYLAPYFLFVISGYEMLRMSKQMPFKQKLAIFMFLFFGSSGAIAQAFFFPDVLLNLFTISLGIVIILFFLESQEYQQLVDTLVEMKELNEKANEAMGLKNRFLNNISHNLAAPIKGVVDADERIKSATDDSDIIACTEEIQKLCASVLGHMDDILEYVDLDLDNLVIEEKKYNVYDMMDVCIKGLEDEAQKKGIAIVRQFSSIPQFLCGDRERIAQALRKLIKNAIEYTETGTITIRLQSREINKESRYLIISVEDTGIGIPENMHKHIFEVFEKGNDTNKGMGVGLSYAKRVVELMGGHVDMYSTEGKGSLFYIEVPQKNVFESI